MKRRYIKRPLPLPLPSLLLYVRGTDGCQTPVGCRSCCLGVEPRQTATATGKERMRMCGLVDTTCGCCADNQTPALILTLTITLTLTLTIGLNIRTSAPHPRIRILPVPDSLNHHIDKTTSYDTSTKHHG